MELFATPVAYLVFVTGHQEADTVATISQAATDNKSNGFALDKLMTTKYPLSLMLMELSVWMEENNDTLQLNWMRRDKNQPGDDLTNEDFTKFDMNKRIEVSITKDKVHGKSLKVLSSLMQAADSLHKEVLIAKKQTTPFAKLTRNNKKEKFRIRQPW